MAAPVNVTPGGQNTHHVKIGSDIGLILCNRNGDIDPLAYHPSPTNSALQIRQGEQSYQDEAQPWSLKSQNDWSGGRGSESIDKALNKYDNGYRINTTRPGSIIPAGFDSYGKYREEIKQWNGTYGDDGIYIDEDWLSDSNDSDYQAFPLYPSATFGARYVWLWVRRRGTPANSLTVALYSNSSSKPNTLLASGTLSAASMENNLLQLVRISLGAGTTLSASTEYWLVIHSSGSTDTDGWSYLHTTEAFSYSGANTVLSSDDGTTWASYYAWGLLYRITPLDDHFAAHYFEYKGALYAALNYQDGGVSKLYMEGDQGVVKNSPTPTTTTCTLDSGTATWAADEAIGSIFMIVAGTGSNQPKPFGLITDNGATSGGETSLTYEELDIAPGSDSEIVIVGSQKWTVLDTTTAPSTGAGWAAGEKVTGVLSVNHGVYFAMGDSVVMSRMRRYNSGGVWTTEWNDETGQFTHLEWANDQDGQYIWGAKGGYPSTIAKAPSIDCSGTGAASDLTFESAINTGDVGKRVRSLTKYGEFANLHIMKEDVVMQVVPDDVVVPVGLAQMGMASDYRNGVASVVHKGYLYWSYHNTILRYYDGFLNNSGPSTEDVGVPDDRIGICERLLSYENMLIALYNGGADNYSTVMVHNGQGWCEFYRSPNVGMVIRGGTTQALPGDNVDRLHFSCGTDLVNMPIATDPVNHPRTNEYHFYNYSPGAHIESSWYYFGKEDTEKMFSTVRGLFTNLSQSNRGCCNIEYKLDDDGSYTLPTIYQVSAWRSDITLSSTYDVVGNRLKVRTSFETFTPGSPPDVRAIVARALVQQDVNEYVDLTALIEDNGMSLLEDVPDYYSSADSKVAAIKAWAATPQPALFRWHDSLLDNKYYKIDSPSLRATAILDELSGQMKHILAMRVYLVE